MHSPQVSAEADEWRSTSASFTRDHGSWTRRRPGIAWRHPIALLGAAVPRALRASRLSAVSSRPGCLAARLPESACFTSPSSAELRGWWQPARVSHPVFVSVLSDAAHPQRRGLSVSRHPRPVDFETIDEIRVASAAETLLAVAKDLGVIDLVIIGDSALHQGACTIDQLSTAAAGRRRGAPQLRKVIPILDGRSESPWESILRLPISGWLEQVGCTSMTARCIAIETHIARIWRESAAWSRSTGSASVSRHRSCSTKEARSSPA